MTYEELNKIDFDSWPLELRGIHDDGYDVGYDGAHSSLDNPYPKGTLEYDVWLGGYKAGCEDY